MTSGDPGSSRVLVIGGGIMGLSIAWRLAEEGCAVSICEKGLLAQEASWAAAGMLAPGGEFTNASPLTQLALTSRALYPEFVRKLETASGRSIDYQECGGLDLAYSDEELVQLEAKAAAQQAIGIGSKPVSAAHVKAFWPRLQTEGLQGARFYPQDALVDPRDLNQALAVACRKAGVVIREHCEVSQVEVEPGHVSVRCAAEPTAHYAAAIIAAGAWSSSIPIFGVPALPTTEPVKGQLIAYQQPLQTCNTILRHGHRYIVQRANGLLLVGASMHRVGFDREPSAEVSSALEAEAGRLLPHLAETAPTTGWIGFRPGADEPHIGPWHSDRLLLAYGHFRNGVLLAPITADRIAAQVTSSLGMRSGARA